MKGQVMCVGSGVPSSSTLSGMKGKMLFMAADKEEEDTERAARPSGRTDLRLGFLP